MIDSRPNAEVRVGGWVASGHSLIFETVNGCQPDRRALLIAEQTAERLTHKLADWVDVAVAD